MSFYDINKCLIYAQLILNIVLTKIQNEIILPLSNSNKHF